MILYKRYFTIGLIFFSTLSYAKHPNCVVLDSDGNIQNNPAAKQLVTQVDEMIFQMGNMPGLLIGIIDKDKKTLISCGSISKDDKKRPTGNTIWQIGSVSKVITTTIFAMMIQANKINLVAPLSDYVPSGSKVPQYQQRSITLLDLATHSSGLPREASNVDDGLGDYQNNPTLKANKAYSWLSSYQLNKKPGTHYQYSNIGFGLLGNALALAEKMTYGELVNQYITQKLKMIDTTTRPNAEQKKREAKSYWMNGDLIRKDWPFDFNQPSGGIYSTGNDLFNFLEFNLNNTKSVINATNQIAHASYLYADMLDNKLSFAASAMALGWEVENPHNYLPVLLYKNGWVSGFNTWVMLAPSEHMAIFSVSNKPYLMMKSSLESLIRGRMQVASNKK